MKPWEFPKRKFMKGRFRWDGLTWVCLRPIQWTGPTVETAPRRFLGINFRVGP